MQRYALTLEDADGNPAVATPEIVMAMNENLAQHDIAGAIAQDANGVHLLTDANLEALVNANKLRKLVEGDDGYLANQHTYVLEEIGEDDAHGIYNAMFSVPRGGRRRKTRKGKGKTKKTRRFSRR